MGGLRAIALGAALGLIAALPTTAQQQIDLYGVTSATLEWSPASGPVTGYYVIVARNGGTPSLQGVATQTRATVASSYGDVVMVQVAAFDEGGLAGPVSQPSSAIRFNPSAPTSDPTTTPPDPDLQDPSGGSGGGGSGTPGETPVAATHTRFDFDGDGLSDLLLRDPQSGDLLLWKMEGAQVLERLDLLAHLTSPWKLQEPGDYDGDGTADLLWRDERTGQLIVWLIRAGAVASGCGLDLGSVTSDWTVAGRGDFDGDGRDDIALALPQPGVVDILHMDGCAIASRVSRNAPSDRWRLVATPDADGDGTAELVWENVDTHALAIEHMSAPGRAAALVSEPGDWRVLGAGDFDGDGRDDLLARQSSSGQVRAWLLDGDRARPAGWGAKAGDSNWACRGVGDFDGDGLADSFWHNPTAAAVEIWFSVPGGSDSAFVSDRPVGMRPVGDDGD